MRIEASEMDVSTDQAAQRLARLLRDAPRARRDAVPVGLTLIDSPLGPLIAGTATTGIVLLEFTDELRLQRQMPALLRRYRCVAAGHDSPHLTTLREQLTQYFHGERRRFELPLHAPGTPFQRRVWTALATIPYGETRSYQALAAQIGAPSATRAVGLCNGLNRIAILIPCHRLLGRDGALTGYGSGLWRKRALLALEQGQAASDSGSSTTTDRPRPDRPSASLSSPPCRRAASAAMARPSPAPCPPRSPRA